MPMADSVLIFDEVKVISRLLWISRSQTIVGLAMTADDQASLHDVYQLFDKNKAADQTAYIMQFLWRDLTYFNGLSHLKCMVVTLSNKMNVAWPNNRWLVLISSTAMYSTIVWLPFQQEQVLSELYNYVSQQPPPTDAQKVQLTLKYLEEQH